MTSETLVEQAEARMSGKHSCDMHNTIAKLKRIPIQHLNGRKKVEDAIVHLKFVHNVQITPNLKVMLLEAMPSKKLLDILYEGEIN